MMAIFSCKCLNVTLESDKMEEISDIGVLKLSLTEQRDIFFTERLLSCPANLLKKYIIQPALIGQRTVGPFRILESCLACGTTTHAILHDRNIALMTKSIQTTQEQINNLKKSENFSPVFNLLVPEVTSDIEMKENVDINNQLASDKNGCSPSLHLIGTLRKQLNQTLQSQLEAIEETVRLFKEQKYAEYEAYRARAQRDHKVLASIISKTRSNNEKDTWANNGGSDNGPPSPLLPPLQRRRLSSIKDVKKFNENVKARAQIPHEEDSLDAEDIFDIEGMDSRHYMASDQDDYDSDECSNDEGIQIGRSRVKAVDIAQSLPINMPNFPMERTSARDLDDYEEPQDIAASIKALAQSVHGDVFELPRPRFSTQI